jgi:predicted nucleotidyltransferase
MNFVLVIKSVILYHCKDTSILYTSLILLKRQKMKIAAIISEYNPFHNGHMYHIRKTREMLPGCYIISIMSGNFVQRGEPAIADKWTRAEAALKGGADMVVELPFLFAAQSAEGFAGGAVRIASALGCVTHLSFGSEDADSGRLENARHFLSTTPPTWTR